ncbi:FecR domain-containing protein [Thauera linaloolentis]|uniref:Fe2+-dicitrate sensor, membrane protein n=1 Tax=Thauera linaloolentis (strain DSM 12138 / JCM 21573 / CCUG 41526 / CIP 105981 / IAM 15112 / NBRC 102519 / 47Lol) TaxID=1123367 RepID=N6XXE5_THAL4|nr:FecR domain-containing protein [Thauera linaloolentis]ENO86466.1 Fe2+-dicitrate sensor, membrane protein [Thauera linaloolentis 47Lol = DSM 12138]MCM8567345.1 FecR domain-containing protein [Thauera linaloolentis]
MNRSAGPPLGRQPDGRPALDPEVVEQAVAWHVALLSGSADDAQRAACLAWRQASEAHECAWQRIAALGQGMRAASGEIAAPLARQVLRSATGGARRTVLKTFAGLGLLGGGALLARELRLHDAIGADYRSATGEQRWIALADGTRLLLNTATSVDVHYDAEQRRVHLRHGEILVESAPDAARRPFLVSTAQGDILPVGTRFSVRQERDGGPVGVAVFDGAVDLRPARGTALRLRAGQQSAFTAGGAAPAQPLRAGQEAWRDGMLVVERMPLPDFIAELDRYRPGRLRCDPAVAHLRVSGAFPLHAPDEVLALLAETLPIRIGHFTRYWVTVGPRT